MQTTIERPAVAVDSFPQQTVTTQQSRRKRASESRKLRKGPRALAALKAEAEAEIERLLALVDQIDGDSDIEIEDEHDEDTYDREVVCEDEGAQDADVEPSLGWPEQVSQAHGVWGRNDDREQGGHAVPPQNRTAIDGADKVGVENSYRRFLHGVSPDQKAALKKRQRQNTDVVTR